MLILGMDTAITSCSVAIWNDKSLVSHRSEKMVRGQAESLVPMIVEVLNETELKMNNFNLIAVTTGPGAFTGIRIGLATARAMSVAVNIPCIGLTTTEVIAHGVDESERKDGALVVAIESKRADIYVQAFQCSLKPMCDPRAINPSMLGEWLENAPTPITIVGDAKERATEELVKRGFKNINVGLDDVPKASTLVKMAFQRWNPRVSLAAPSPLYLRQPDAKLPKLEGRLRL